MEQNLEREELMEHPYKSLLPKQKKVLFPAITKFSTFLHANYGEGILHEIRQQIFDGSLASCLDLTDYTEDCLHLQDLFIMPDMNFWRINRFEFVADLQVFLSATVRTEEQSLRICHKLYVSVVFSLEDQVTYSVETISTEEPIRDSILLDDYLIPIMNYEDVETAGCEELTTYMPGALKDIRNINAYTLANRMGLTIKECRLYNRPKTRSILFWIDSKVKVLLEDSEEPVEITIPAYTIVINTERVSLQSRALNIFHECFHAEYHWLFYRLQEMHNSDLKSIAMKKRPLNKGKPPKNPLPLLEWQAKQGSRVLLLPRQLFLPRLREYVEENQQLVRHMGRSLELAGIRIADEWGLPKYIVRARMLHLGWWQAQGALNFVSMPGTQGEYIRPFLFDRESCPTTAHTFVIDPIEAFRLYENNEEYRARIDSGLYIFVEGHVCINSPAYIRETKTGPRMTDWANRHIDECCLRFENIYELDEHYEFRLNCINSDEEYNKHYNDFVADGRILSSREANEKQAALIAALPHVPGEALKKLMEIKGITKEELAESALVSVSTVKNWRKQETSFSPETALRLIVALSMPPWLSYWFLDMAKVPLQYKGLHLLYRDIINCRYMDSLHTNNEWLKAAGYKGLKETA